MTQVERLDVSAICGGPTAVLEAIRDEIKMIRGKTPLRDLMVIGDKIVRQRLHQYAYDVILPKLQAMYGIYEMMNGPFNPEWVNSKRAFQRDAFDNWTAGLDDQIEVVFDEYNGVVTADFIGENSVGVALWEPGAIEALAGKFASDAVKVATWIVKDDHGGPKTPAQVMAAVGLVEADFKEMLDTRDEPSQQQVEQHQMNSLQDAVGRINTFTGMMGIAGKALVNLLDNATDSDDGLATGAITQIGGEPGDVAALRTARGTMGLEGLANVIENNVSLGTVHVEPAPALVLPQDDTAALEALLGLSPTPGSVPPLPPPPPLASAPVPQPPTAEKPSRSRRGKGNPEPGTLPPRLLLILRDFSGLKLDELGAQIGTSRTTYDKYAEGKSFLAPSEEQKQALRTIIEHRLEVMREAMNLLDSAQ